MQAHFFAITGLVLGVTFASMSTQAHEPEQQQPLVQITKLATVLDQAEARKAILAMAGDYKVDFRFEELFALKPGYKLHDNDNSSGYETVRVIEDTPKKIVLQHILVTEGGQVVKHWRQDWEYEQPQSWVYNGGYSWKKINLEPSQVAEKWLQTVWQIDDSPRYAGYGQWEKNKGVVAWTSNETMRPLPRREHTVRSDYDVIVGINRQVLTPNGWVHEQDNIKYDQKTHQPLARELGLNQYTKVQDFDFKPADEYWKNNQAYWQQVRQAWAEAFAQNEVLALKQTGKDEKAHYSYFNQQAQTLAGKKVKDRDLYKTVLDTLNQQLVQGKVQ
ncbi:DUF6607 family protein [Alkanindiges sp. WGS2144]|uniref:DUF6607 family protein n=1 Tax=Alkanindiges sp. WGS2144 TaxID=3366808 RepID=UPI0037528CBD